MASNSQTPPTATMTQSSGGTKFRVFVDFWNLQLTFNQRHQKQCDKDGVEYSVLRINWQKLPQCLVREAARLMGINSYSYEGTIVFTSYNPKKPEDTKYHKWATTWLDRQPGIQVQCYERRDGGPPKCPSCHREISVCSFSDCGQPLQRSIEKGVDTAIATDMIRLAWENAYEVAVLATSDADLVPAVEFLDLKGIRVVQAGFPPHGSHLARACWGSMDIYDLRGDFRV